MTSQGRPSSFTQEIADEIVDRLSKGEPLAEICRDDHMPAVRTVSDWKRANEAFSADFACARDEGYDQIAADCLRIADDSSGDDDPAEEELEGQGHGGALKRRRAGGAENVQRSKLRIETRLKLLAKWDPKRYGDKVALTGGGEGDAPIRTALTVSFV